MMVAVASAQNGQIDDARTALAAFGEKFDAKGRAVAVGTVAIAMAKGGQDC